MMVVPAARSSRTISHMRLAQLHVDAGGRLVEEEHPWLVGERLGDQHPATHAARELIDLAVALVPERELAQDPSM